uniref:Amidohydrolase-related domain-containing protein n=1 Tax=Bionectria ochroleuca TaxID=29856 RepID=A0A0B7KNE1_BIOOC
MRSFKLLVSVAAVLPAVAVSASKKLLSGGTIVSFDHETESLKVIRGGSILIDGDRIEKVFEDAKEANASIPIIDTTLQTGDSSASVEVIDCTNKIITPGFIDTHRHGWQTVFKTMGSNTTLPDYLWRYSAVVAQPLFTPDDLYISQLVGLYEAVAAGVTTTLDHAHHTWSSDAATAGLRATIDSGLRVFWAYAFQPVYENFPIQKQISQWKQLVSQVAGTITELAVAYDFWTESPFIDKTTTDNVIDLLNEYKPLLTTHHVEGPWLMGNSPQDLNKAGILSSSIPIVFSHSSFIDTRGANLLRATNKHISITPESEMHYGHTHPTSHLILDQASLGVDTHFTFSTDILTQARLYLHPFSVNQAFLLATRNGGLALGRKDLGVIAPDAKADIVVWDGRSPALLGWADPVAAIILHASVGDIEHVLVNGEFKKRDRRLVVEGYDEAVDKFLEAANRIQDTLRKLPLPSQEGAFFTGTPLVQAETLDVLRGAGNGYGPQFV